MTDNAHHLLESHHSMSRTANTNPIHSAAADHALTVHAYGRPIPHHLSPISPVQRLLFPDTGEKPRVNTPALSHLHEQTPLLPSGHPPPLPIPPEPPPIRAPTFVIPSRISSCDTSDSDPTYLHSTNLAVLHAMFPSPKLLQFSSTTTLKTPLTVYSPNFPLTSDNWTNIASAEETYSVDYKKLPSAAKSNIKIFKTHVDELS